MLFELTLFFFRSPAENRVSAGVAGPTKNGVRKGETMGLFDYSGKKLLSKKDMDVKVKEKIKEQKAIASSEACKKKDIATNIARRRIDDKAPIVRTIGHECWKGINMNVENPFIEKYGQVNWRKELIAEFAGKFSCITALMKHIFWECDRIFKGSTREKDWALYHDGLTLWFAEDSQEFLKTMKNKDGQVPEVSYYDRQWIITGSTNDKVHKRYKNKVTGNRFEMMPLGT